MTYDELKSKYNESNMNKRFGLDFRSFLNGDEFEQEKYFCIVFRDYKVKETCVVKQNNAQEMFRHRFFREISYKEYEKQGNRIELINYHLYAIDYYQTAPFATEEERKEAILKHQNNISAVVMFSLQSTPGEIIKIRENQRVNNSLFFLNDGSWPFRDGYVVLTKNPESTDDLTKHIYPSSERTFDMEDNLKYIFKLINELKWIDPSKKGGKDILDSIFPLSIADNERVFKSFKKFLRENACKDIINRLSSGIKEYLRSRNEEITEKQKKLLPHDVCVALKKDLSKIKKENLLMYKIQINDLNDDLNLLNKAVLFRVKRSSDSPSEKRINKSRALQKIQDLFAGISNFEEVSIDKLMYIHHKLESIQFFRPSFIDVPEGKTPLLNEYEFNALFGKRLTSKSKSTDFKNYKEIVNSLKFGIKHIYEYRLNNESLNMPRYVPPVLAGSAAVRPSGISLVLADASVSGAGGARSGAGAGGAGAGARFGAS